ALEGEAAGPRDEGEDIRRLQGRNGNDRADDVAKEAPDEYALQYQLEAVAAVTVSHHSTRASHAPSRGGSHEGASARHPRQASVSRRSPPAPRPRRHAGQTQAGGRASSPGAKRRARTPTGCGEVTGGLRRSARPMRACLGAHPRGAL